MIYLADRFGRLLISRQIIREYCVILSRPQAYGKVLDSRTILQQVAVLQESYHIADETEEATANLLTLIETTAVGGKQIHDANIVATMLAYGVHDLYTLHLADFERFSPHITLHTLRVDETDRA